jgi:hypothetical protein
MAGRQPRKEEVRRFRCLNEDFIFPAKIELVGLDAGKEVGYSQGVVRWVEEQSVVECPHDPFHRVEPVKE